MHSFTPSLSLLLSAVLLYTPCALFGSSAVFAQATELAPAVPNGLAARGLGHSSHIGTSHRRRGAEPGNALNVRAGTNLTLYPGRRAAGASFTWFVTGLGACGNFNVASDFIVSLDMEQFDVNSHCGAQVTITINGKVAQATIADRCKSCGYGNLDLTTGLYAYFDPTMNGRLQGEWEFGSGAPAPAPAPPPPKPSPSPSPKPTSTSTTSVWHPAPSTTSISTSAVNSTVNPTTTSTSATAAATTPAIVAGNIEAMFEAFLGMGGIVMGALGTSN